MDLFEAFRERYSYRDALKNSPVPKADLERIVQAGLDAPSAGNRQSTQFVIIDNVDVVAKVKTAFTNQPFVSTALAFIAAIVDFEPKPYREGGYIFILEDCSAAIENILLAITGWGYV
jgi:nitroreductase